MRSGKKKEPVFTDLFQLHYPVCITKAFCHLFWTHGPICVPSAVCGAFCGCLSETLQDENTQVIQQLLFINLLYDCFQDQSSHNVQYVQHKLPGFVCLIIINFKDILITRERSSFSSPNTLNKQTLLVSSARS